MGTQIQLLNVTKKVRNTTLLDSITLTIKEGRTYGFLGEDLVGKDLILKAVCGFIRIDSGSITINGKCIRKHKSLMEEAGIMMGTMQFRDQLTGIENLLQLSKETRLVEAQRAVQKVGLGGVELVKVANYSAQMKQRLRLAFAIMGEPSILILENPFQYLTSCDIEEVREILQEHKQRGTTILLTSTCEQSAGFLCDMIYEFQNGQIVNRKVLVGAM